MDDDDGDAATEIHGSCDCMVIHDPSLRCAGCNICYFKSLEIANDKLQKPPTAGADFAHGNRLDSILYMTKFGSVRWICPTCDDKLLKSLCLLNHKKSSKEVLPAKYVQTDAESSVNEALSSLKNESEQMKGLLDNVMYRLDSLVCPPMSPKRKYAKVGWEKNDHDNPIMSIRPFVPDLADDPSKEWPAVPPRKPTMDYASLFKVNISASDENNSDMLKNLHSIKGDMPAFRGSKNRNGSVDVVFQNLEDATKAKKLLDTKLQNIDIKDPMPKSLKRYNLVGLQFKMDSDEVVDALIDENKHLFNLHKLSNNIVSIEGDPSSCIQVHEISKCRRNGFRVVVSISANMMASLGNTKLCLGYTKCKLYPWTYHKRCYNCNEIGHHANVCENPSTCSKCGSEEHKLQQCTNDEVKCVNCVKNNMNDTGHPAYSSVCPYNRKSMTY